MRNRNSSTSRRLRWRYHHGLARVDNIYTKGGRTGQLNFVDMVTDYKNQQGQVVVRDRTSFIVRDQEVRYDGLFRGREHWRRPARTS
jgi:hypothetical protein